MNLKGKNVFLSGPMSGFDALNVEGFAAAHHKVKEAGAKEVYDPAVEYLTKGSSKDSHQECMRRTLHELTRSTGTFMVDNVSYGTEKRIYDAIVMLPGWEGSIGARTELDVAIACGIEVVMLQDVEPYDDNGLLSCKVPESWFSVTASSDCASAKDASHSCNMAKE